MGGIEYTSDESPRAGSFRPYRLAERVPRHTIYFVLTAVLLAFAAAALQTYRSVERELTGAVLARRSSIAYLAAATLSGRFDRAVDLGISLATRPRVQELAAAGKWTEAAAILSSVPSDFNYIERVFLTNPDGTLMADVPELPGVRGQNFAHREWYRGVSADWTPYVSSVYRRAAPPQRKVFAAAMPIRGLSDRVLGILVLQVKLDAFFNWTRAVDLGPGGLIYVVDSRRQVAFHPQLSAQENMPDLSGNPFVERLARGESGVEIGPGPIGNETTVSAFVPAKRGWGVVAWQPASAAFGARDYGLRRVVVGFLLILAFCVALAYLSMHLVLQRRRADEERRVKSELERLVAERTSQLQSANKELQSFSYSVSHDLRAPLRAIDGYARMIEEDHGQRLDGEGRRMLGVVRASATQMARLIDDLLAFSRLGRKPIAVSPVDMSALAREVAQELAGEHPAARINVAEMPAIQGDRALLRQVWMNLIDNALKYSAKVAAPRIEIGGTNEGAEHAYWVRDNGVGFDMRYAEKLFGVFQRLHDPGEFPGTGVGLAIVHRVVARHGGRVWAEGKVNEGARFGFALPRAGGKA